MVRWSKEELADFRAKRKPAAPPPPTKAPTKRRHEEDDEQASLFAWRDAIKTRFPLIGLLYAIPNGAHLSGTPIGDGAMPPHVARAIRAKRLKKQGMFSGMPDVALPVPRNNHGALYIELKKCKGGVVSPEQRERITLLRDAGNRVEVCAGWQAARTVVLDYMGIKEMI